MSDYAVLTWPEQDQVAGTLAHALGQTFAREGRWTCAADQPGLQVWIPILRPPRVTVMAGRDGVVIGDVFGASPAAASQGSAIDRARRMTETAWGRYVMVFREPGGRARAMFRDPSGALDALAWRAGGVTIVASDLHQSLMGAAPPGLAINWELIGAGLVDRLQMARSCPLIGILAVTPGALRELDGDQTETLIWRPAAFARRGLANTAETRAELVRRIDDCVAALAGLGDGAVAEMSGGLDSSIVASALCRAPSVRVLQWLNYYVDDPGGDERSFARATAAHLGVSLTEILKPGASLGMAAMAQGADGARPSWRLVDGGYDQDLAARCRTLGAGQIFTGLGGDTVFMQGGSPLLGADYLKGRPPWAIRPTALAAIARHARHSVWSVGRRAILAGLPFGTKRAPPAHLTMRALAAAARQPRPLWLQDLANVTPTKQGQIEGLAQTLLLGGRSARTRQADLVNPLLSQPIMEHGLSLSAMALTAGGDDRAMAREAFADRLPRRVLDRRSKGDLSRHYGQMVGRDLDALRDLLLDGQLVSAGLVDPDQLDQLLSVETLIWSGPYRDIIAMVVLELWVRSWSMRLAGLTRRVLGESLVEPV